MWNRRRKKTIVIIIIINIITIIIIEIAEMPVIVPETETYITTWFCAFQDLKTLLKKSLHHTYRQKIIMHHKKLCNL